MASYSPAHKEKWASLVKAPRSVKRLPSFEKWMPVTEMFERVNHVIGESLSREEMISKLPPIESFRTELGKELACKDNGILEYFAKSGLKVQKFESILPALKLFIDRFNDQAGSIYDIPARCVELCGFSDQFHWALTADYYEVTILERSNFNSLLALSEKILKPKYLKM